jgi:hypothetical protein
MGPADGHCWVNEKGVISIGKAVFENREVFRKQIKKNMA